MAATGNDDRDEVLESTSCSGVLSAEGLAPWGARESVCAPDTVGVSAGSGCWSAVSQTGGQRASEAQSSGGCESESSVSPRLGSVLWGLLQRHRSHWGGRGEAPLLRPNRLRRPRPLPPSRGGSGSPQSGRGHVHAARKSGVRNASVRTRRRGQTLLRARPGQADAENSSDSACTSENVGLRRLTPQMKDGGSEPRQRKSQKKTEADY